MALKIASRFRRLLQRPGSIDLGPYERLTQLVGEAEESVRSLTDDELTEAVAELRTSGGLHEDEQIEFLALARDAGRRATAGWLRQLADQIETLPLEDAAELLTWVGHALEQLRVEAERILKRE